jgi:hypothetical protein
MRIDPGDMSSGSCDVADDDSTGDRRKSSRAAAVNWAAAETAVEALALTAAPTAWPLVEPLARRLLVPLVHLERLVHLAARASSGDERAVKDLHRYSAAQVAAHPEISGLFERFCSGEEQSVSRVAASCCSDHAAHNDRADEERLTNEDIIQESTLAELVLHLIRAGASTHRACLARTLDVAMSQLLAAGPIVLLARAYRLGARHGLLDQMRELSAGGGMAPMMQLSGAMGPGDLPEFPSVPALAGFPGELGDLQWPPGLKPVGEIIGELRKPRQWDREYWQPFTPFERAPQQFFPGYTRLLNCLREVARRIAARSALPPPPRPSRVTWADGITRIEQLGACVGDVIVIHGSGFMALRLTAVLLIPHLGGCRPVAVPEADWTDTAIRVRLPPEVSSGPVGFADAAYVAAYSAWVAEQDRLAREIESFYCYALSGPISIAPRFADCPPDLAINRLRAGAAVIEAFAVNGLSTIFVEPNTPLTLDWTVRNAETVIVERLGNQGPTFYGSTSITNPSYSSFTLGPFTGDTPVEAIYRLTATGPCGDAVATVHARLQKIPKLRITGIEVTQGIQKFRSPDGSDNSILPVALKDTVVRVYVAADQLDGFKHDFVAPDRIAVSGELRVGGMTLPPLNTISAQAQPSIPLARASTNGTLNFRIPAAAAQGVKTLRVRAWTAAELDDVPDGAKVRPMSSTFVQTVTWVDKAPFRIRYVRVSDSVSAALTDPLARSVVVRAFDFLATPPTDIAAARVPLWHTGEDLNTKEGIRTLMEHIDDQHDCTTSEWLLPWEEDCPDDDGAVWVAVLPRSGWGGMAQRWRLFNASRNSVVVTPTRDVAAHELGHTLKLNHVNVGGGFEEGEDFDTLPSGGAIRSEDAFDPFGMRMVLEGAMGFSGIFDMMSYAPLRWISPMNWQRVFNKF